VVIWGDGTVEDAVDICGQEVLDKTLSNDADVSFGVYQSATGMLYLYKMDPNTGAAEKLENGAGPVQAKAAMMKACAEANYDTLSKPLFSDWIWNAEHRRNYRYVTVGGQQQIEWAPQQ
jgi:hypothetical protein